MVSVGAGLAGEPFCRLATSQQHSCFSSEFPQHAPTIDKGILNRYAIKFAVPKVPPEARAKKRSGRVTVQLLVDAVSGQVVWAGMISGPALLHEAVGPVVCGVSFAPANVAGPPVRVAGVLVYEFRQGRYVQPRRLGKPVR